MTIWERIQSLNYKGRRGPIVKMDKKKEDKRPTITKNDVERFLWYCSDNDLIKVLLWTVAEVCVRFYNRDKKRKGDEL